jgi:hypothetical protein
MEKWDASPEKALPTILIMFDFSSLSAVPFLPKKNFTLGERCIFHAAGVMIMEREIYSLITEKAARFYKIVASTDIKERLAEII